MSYFAAHHLGTQCSVMVTGSHNPPDYNGLKMVIAGDDARRRRHPGAARAHRGRHDLDAAARGTLRTADIAQAYFDRIAGDVQLARPMSIAVDCGNGVAGAYAPELFRRLGCDVTELYLRGRRPLSESPSRSVAAEEPAGADRAAWRASDNELGLAFDGDGDRLGVVTKNGAIIYPDRQLMLFAADVLSRNPGATVIYDVKSTRNLQPWITRHGGTPLMWKTGHSLIKAKMKETGALLAGEMSGHTFFKERWYGFDDGMYAARATARDPVARMPTPRRCWNRCPTA